MKMITWGRWTMCLTQSRDTYIRIDIQICSPAASALTVKQLPKYFPLTLHLPANNLKMHYKLLITPHSVQRNEQIVAPQKLKGREKKLLGPDSLAKLQGKK